MARYDEADKTSDVPGRALVAVGLAESAGRVLPSPRPSAPFLAQLIAHQQQAPQTRLRRRVEPATARATYMAGSAAPLPRLSVRA